MIMNYRPEIDGLRAFAIISVILFHAGLRFFEGGYVGVDVFFVISGYLITKLILEEIQAGTFNIVNFYERRARRLLPALYFVMTLCIPFAWFLLIPSDLKEFGQSLIYVSFFASNFLFWLESGYFDISSELRPLLHTWSLAIEEQFYILFPICFLLLWRFRTKSIIFILLSIFLLSFYLAELATLYAPNAGFYLLPTRAWELLIGVFTAFFLNGRTFFRSLLINQTISLFGLIMIFYSVFAFDESRPFPGRFALIPTLGTSLVILFTAPKTIVYKLLTLKPIVGIGLISYSAYLLHQPILAFLRHMYYGKVSDILIFILCIFSIFLSWISYRYIESPFRKNKGITSKNIFLFSILGLIIFPLVGIGMQLQFFYSKSPNILQNHSYTSLNDKLEKVGSVCNEKEIVDLDQFKYCEIGSKEADRSVIIYGDSHMEAIQYQLDKKLLKNNIKGIWVTEILAGGFLCNTTIFTTRYKNLQNQMMTSCPDSFSKMLDNFSESEFLILHNRWSRKYYYSGSDLNTPHFENKALNCKELEEYRSFVPLDKNGVKEPTKSSMDEALINFLALSSSKIKTIVIYPVPEIGCHPYRINLAYKNKHNSEIVSLSFPIEEYDFRNRSLIDNFDKFLQHNKSAFIPVPIRSLFCQRAEKDACMIFENSKPLYLDDDHVSDYGAELIVNKMLDKMDASKHSSHFNN